jgi:hypothetical protein
MSLTFTELNTGATLIIPKTDIQYAVNLEEFCQLILVNDTVVDLSDSWAYVYGQITGGGGEGGGGTIPSAGP